MRILDLEALKRASLALSEEAGALRDLNRRLLNTRLAMDPREEFRETGKALEELHEDIGKEFLLLEDFTEVFDYIIRHYERLEEELAERNAAMGASHDTDAPAL